MSERQHIGASRAEQVSENAKASRVQLDATALKRIEEALR